MSDAVREIIPPEMTSSEVLLGALPALHRYALILKKEHFFFALLAYWLTPREFRPHPLITSPETWQENFTAFVQEAKEFAASNDERACLDRIIEQQSTLDFSPAEYLLGCL